MGAAAPTVPTPPVIAEDHPVRRRLANGVLPYLLLCRQLKKERLYQIHKVYSWSRDGLAAAVGTGLLPPIFGLLLNVWNSQPGAEGPVRSALFELPTGLLILGVFAFLILAALKLIVTKRETEKKAVLTDNCCKEFGVIRNNLDRLLQTKNPLPGLIDYQSRIAATVDRLINEDCWPFEAPFSNVQNDVAQLTKFYCDTHGSNWTAVSELGGQADA